MRGRPLSDALLRCVVLLVALHTGGLVACESGPQPMQSGIVYGPAPASTDAAPVDDRLDPAAFAAAVDPATLGARHDRLVDFVFEGGQVELELYRRGTTLVQIARNTYAVPVVIKWQIQPIQNVRGLTPLLGSTVLPPGPRSESPGPWVRLATLEQVDPRVGYRRGLQFRGRWGDPAAQPVPYAYRLPYPRGKTFAVLQGFHGAFSHRGSNEFAIDFDCPVATPVLAAREGVVVALNAAAVGAGESAAYLDHKRVNFVIVRHDDGTLGEYMHLAPSSVVVKAGDRVRRGTQLALSGNTGFSSTPHLHFQLMTAGPDGISARSFPFTVSVGKGVEEEPKQGKRYPSWE